MIRKVVASFVLVVAFCHMAMAQHTIPGPHALVYKTRKDYSNYVPVILSADRKHIVSYPDPQDVKNDMMKPTALQKKYLLDNRGINKQVAFLSITYADYAALPAPPTEAAMLGMIKDKAPLRELCDCSVKNTVSVKQLNAMIEKKTLRKKCKVIK